MYKQDRVYKHYMGNPNPVHLSCTMMREGSKTLSQGTIPVYPRQSGISVYGCHGNPIVLQLSLSKLLLPLDVTVQATMATLVC